MELKFPSSPSVVGPALRSNRTFMELKSRMNKLQFSTLQSSNRTFMELKWKRLFITLPSKMF